MTHVLTKGGYLRDFYIFSPMDVKLHGGIVCRPLHTETCADTSGDRKLLKSVV